MRRNVLYIGLLVLMVLSVAFALASCTTDDDCAAGSECYISAPSSSYCSGCDNYNREPDTDGHGCKTTCPTGWTVSSGSESDTFNTCDVCVNNYGEDTNADCVPCASLNRGTGTSGSCADSCLTGYTTASAGDVGTASIKCDVCANNYGFAADGVTCVTCASLNRDNGGTDGTCATTCSAGYTTAGDATNPAVKCDVCATNYGFADDGTTCVTCASLNRGNGLGAGTCAATCLDGYTTASAGDVGTASKKCGVCATNYGFADDGTTCVTCASLNRGTGATGVCATACLTGYTTADAGDAADAHIECDVCSTGYIMNATNSCVACSSLHRVNGTTSGCGACVTGSASSNATADVNTDCDICTTGYGKDGNNMCVACTANTYWSNSTCKACDAGKFSPAQSTICCAVGSGVSNGACVACANNQYTSGGLCQACEANKYAVSTATNATQCCVVHANYSATASACLCNSGYEMTNGVCTQCPAGKYRVVTDATTTNACTTCADNTFAPVPGFDVACLACPAKTYSGVHVNKSTALCFCNATGVWTDITNPNGTCYVQIPSPAAHTVAFLPPMIIALIVLALTWM